jgi:hypothetical protein
MFDWHFVLGIIAGLISFGAIIPYVKDILHGTTRPNVISYALWVLLLLISIFAQISSGTSWSVIFIIGDLIGSSVVVVLCLSGYGYKKYGKTEWICTGLALLAIVSWQVTSQPVLAIIFAVLADLMAAIPTVIKSYQDPWSESSTIWFLIAFAAILSLISTTIFNPSNLLFPIYLLLINSIIGTLVFFGRRFKTKLN